ncbi:MAG: ATP-binding cassette domain-containing protein [Bacteroidota bacterium]
MEPIVQFAHVSVSFAEKIILQEANLALLKGEFSYLVGPTGTGKSTIMKLIYGDVKPKYGHIRVGEFRVETLTYKELPFLRRKLGIVFQDYQLLPDRSVYQNIYFALKASGWRSSSRIKARIQEVLMKVGMAGKAESLPHQLSGGEQQRVTIARALINDPFLMVADEPTGNLDPEASHKIMELLWNIHYGGTTILMATHEYPLIQQFPSKVLEVQNGKIVDHPQASVFLEDYRNRLHTPNA